MVRFTEYLYKEKSIKPSIPLFQELVYHNHLKQDVSVINLVDYQKLCLYRENWVINLGMLHIICPSGIWDKFVYFCLYRYLFRVTKFKWVSWTENLRRHYVGHRLKGNNHTDENKNILRLWTFKIDVMKHPVRFLRKWSFIWNRSTEKINSNLSLFWIFSFLEIRKFSPFLTHTSDIGCIVIFFFNK